MPKITRYQDLVAWQLSMELADLVDAMICTEPASKSHDFCHQIQTSSAKAAPQIAEGFVRFRPTESAYYYRIARASLAETQTHLLRGQRRRYWSEPVFKKAWDVSEGALKTTTGLLNSRLQKIAEEKAKNRRSPMPQAQGPWPDKRKEP